jgi:hypothetical protein
MAILAAIFSNKYVLGAIAIALVISGFTAFGYYKGEASKKKDIEELNLTISKLESSIKAQEAYIEEQKKLAATISTIEKKTDEATTVNLDSKAKVSNTASKAASSLPVASVRTESTNPRIDEAKSKQRFSKLREIHSQLVKGAV